MNQHRLVDIINFNADASCFSSQRWLEVLQGGSSAEFYRWLVLYVKYNKKVVLGLPGATISDIASFNPEAIELIRQHPHIFEIILRPYAHDVAMVRTPAGYIKNLQVGIAITKAFFGSYTNYFLPPEFMLTNEQVRILVRAGIEGTFILPSRFKAEIRERLPNQPYRVKGLLGAQLNCIPFESQLTKEYLNSLHCYSADSWNRLIKSRELSFSWRDGESSFFIPDGLSREESWLSQEDQLVKRIFLKDALPGLQFTSNEDLPLQGYHSYPIHSFSPWLKEFKMLSFVYKVIEVEKKLQRLSKQQLALWLQLINSDILSAIEKDSPVVRLQCNPVNPPEGPCYMDFTIRRSERGFEGEDFLKIMQDMHLEEVQDYLQNSTQAHIVKLRSRLLYLIHLLK